MLPVWRTVSGSTDGRKFKSTDLEDIKRIIFKCCNSPIKSTSKIVSHLIHLFLKDLMLNSTWLLQSQPVLLQQLHNIGSHYYKPIIRSQNHRKTQQKEQFPWIKINVQNILKFKNTLRGLHTIAKLGWLRSKCKNGSPYIIK